MSYKTLEQISLKRWTIVVVVDPKLHRGKTVVYKTVQLNGHEIGWVN
jgi:hypothetical protein